MVTIMTLMLNALASFMLLTQGANGIRQVQLQELSAKAAKGDLDAALELAHQFDEGGSVPKDPTQAYFWFSKASDLGSREGQEQTGYRELMGIGTQQNPEKALESFRKATQAGSGYASQQIGWMYETGKGVTQNDEMAVQWYQRAVQQGNTDACGALGWLTENGRGTPKDDALAAKLYYTGAEAGDATSQNNLGWLSVEGRGVTGKNYTLAMTLFKQSAAKGNARAMGNMGYLYEHGLGVPQSNTLALDWFNKSAEQGDLKSQSFLAEAYFSGLLSARDLEQSTHFALLSAAKGDQQGLVMLSTLLAASPVPVPKGLDEAYEIIRNQGKDRFPLYDASLGICLLRGIGVSRNIPEARRLLLQSADNPKFSSLLIPVSQNLKSGLSGYPVDLDLSNELLAAAAKSGNPSVNLFVANMAVNPAEGTKRIAQLAAGGDPRAVYELGLRYQNGLGEKLNPHKALELFQSSAAKGFPEAMYHLGLLYQAGILVKADPLKAKQWYERAKAAGHPLAPERFTRDGELAPLPQ